MNSLEGVEEGTISKGLLYVVGVIIGLELLVILSWKVPGAACAGTTLAFGASLYSFYATERSVQVVGRTIAAVFAMKLVNQGVPLLWAAGGVAILGCGGFFWNYSVRNTRDKTAYSRFAFARWLLLVGALWAIAGCAVP